VLHCRHDFAQQLHQLAAELDPPATVMSIAASPDMTWVAVRTMMPGAQGPANASEGLTTGT
jgi:hypothetical protein